MIIYDLSISNIGSFKIKKKNERMGRNPKTMENFKIPSKNKVRLAQLQKLSTF